MKDALTYLASSKTMLMWIAIFCFAFAAIMFATSVSILFHAQVPFINDFFQLMGIGGGAGSARNIISDGVAPRIPQAVAARTDPMVALGSPTPMSSQNNPVNPQGGMPPPTGINYGAPPTAPQ